ncbi:phosphoribosylpyrophosphate synthetase [Algoriphagus persicinus]|uniref:phosphoribosylpyrophosphate synthetase n=1 Tax=Algoriphagus persicinus TaxID=3108754 RepID=UPI002B3DD516|nr:phosphoribosylpyrophosphate synthetase [Algoriphagus sp. E1-3-M2]MEB2787086.1 phosphoribosylpyrophosphate synthetase [Algoriphagus sp. E1-3-M2]
MSIRYSFREFSGTFSVSISGLKNEGYTIDFNIQDQNVICLHSNIALSPDDFQIDKVYRFERATNPDDKSILYAISSTKSDIKGILVNGYGISSNRETDDLISRLKTHPV